MNTSRNSYFFPFIAFYKLKSGQFLTKLHFLSIFREKMSNIATYLSRLQEETNSRLIIEKGIHWIAVRNFIPKNRLLIEISFHKNLPKEQQLSNFQIQFLEKLGYKKRRTGHSIGKMLTLSSAEHEQEFILELKNIFQELNPSFSYPSIFRLHRNIKFTLQNRQLLRAMTTIARNKEHSLRIQFYQEFINSRLLVLIADQKLLPCDTIGNMPSFTAFTDEKNALLYDPRGENLVEDYAFSIIQKVLEQGGGSLIINPRGEPRGELYKTELTSLVNAIKKR